MKTFDVVITDPNGIHARPAGVICKAAKKECTSTITVTKGDASCDMTKLMKLMGMGIKQNDTITISVDGADEEKDAETIKKAMKDNGLID